MPASHSTYCGHRSACLVQRLVCPFGPPWWNLGIRWNRKVNISESYQQIEIIARTWNGYVSNDVACLNWLWSESDIVFVFVCLFVFFWTEGKTHGLKARSSQKLQMHLQHLIEYILKGVLHLLSKISMFCDLSQTINNFLKNKLYIL